VKTKKEVEVISEVYKPGVVPHNTNTAGPSLRYAIPILVRGCTQIGAYKLLALEFVGPP